MKACCSAGKDRETEFGQFMRFEALTMVPFDLEGIDAGMLEESERKTLNAYHRKVRETIGPLLDKEEREWLEAATREI